MHILNIIPKDPVEEFNSKFEYAWRSEKEKPRITAEHYFVNWSIENLKLLLLEEHKSVLSPTFYLDSSKTEWYFEIYPNGLCNEAHNIDIYLYRSNARGPQSVGLTFRFGILQTEDQTMWLKEKKIEDFKQGTFHVVSVDDPERSILSGSKFQYSEIFVITCEMYVTYTIPCYDENLLKPTDYDLINFSFDFSKLMMAIEITDYCVNVTGFRINTHKAILAARSATFREMLQKENSSTEVNLDDICYDNIRRVLHFMYTGNFSLTLMGEPPSIGFYECARKFAVVDLVALLSPKCFKLRSSLITQEFNYMWRVKNFVKRFSAGVTSIKSPPFGAPYEGTPKWYLIVNFGEKVPDQLSIFVETSGENKALHSILKISLIDGSEEIVGTQITTQFKKPGEKIGFPEFLNDFSNHNTKNDFLINDTLQVYCELIFIVSSNVVEVHDVTASEPLNFLDCYRNLSDNVNWLLETSAFSDVTVKTKGITMFDVHKSILFARSRKFYSKFLYYNKGERILDVLDVDPDVLQLMFKHAYSGILNPMSVEDTLRLHKGADLYVFRHLTLMTLHHLASQIDIENFFELLMEEKKLKDRYLKEKCLAFVRENSRRIMEIADWDKYRSEDKELCNSLIALLNEE